MIIDALKDILMNAHDLVILDGAGFWVAALGFIWFCIKSLLYGVFYMLSFQWLTDFVELPSIFKHHYMSILGGKNALENLDNTSTVIFSEVRLNSKGILTGLCNGFFLAIPATVPQLMALRCLIIQDYRRAAVLAMGGIAGQSLFFGLVLFGFEGLLIPFSRLEPLGLFIGLTLLGSYFNDMCTKPIRAIMSQRDGTKLKYSFGLTFSLAWLETGCVFGYFGGISVHSDILQTSEGTKWYFISTLAYYLALVIGCILWTFLFGVAGHYLRHLIIGVIFDTTPLRLMYRRVHGTLLTCIAVMAWQSIPYYGFDYLVSNPFGFIYQDAALNEFQPKTVYIQPTADAEDFDFTIESLATMEDEEEDAVMDFSPFGDETTVLQEKSGFEPTSFPPEVAWENRFEARMRVDEKTAKRAFELELPRPTLWFDQSIFFSPELGEDDIADDEQKIDIMDDLSCAVFRGDGYCKQSILGEDPDYEFEVQTHRVFRDRYLSNPVYKALAKADTLTFLSGQPASANLNVAEEFDLSQRRYILQHYLDFLANFKEFQTEDDVSFATQVYNQQFKGRLHVIRQYNAVRLSFPEMDTTFDPLMIPTPYPDEPDTKPLTYDVPQYNRHHDQYQDYLHEELRPYISNPLWKRYADKGKGEKRPLKNDLDNQLRKKPKRKKPKRNNVLKKGQKAKKQKVRTDKQNKREQRNKRNKKAKKPKKLTKAQKMKQLRVKLSKQRMNKAIGRKLRHMTSNDTRPLYIGWDSEKQKVLVKSAALPSGFTPHLNASEVNQFHFQAWPEWPEQASRLWLEQINLPKYIVTDEELKKIRSSLDYFDFQDEEDLATFGTSMNVEEEMAPGAIREKNIKRMNTIARQQDELDFFRRLSNYDWFWQRLFLIETDETDDVLKAQHLKVGNVIPPRLDGVVWPLMKDNRMWQDPDTRYVTP